MAAAVCRCVPPVAGHAAGQTEEELARQIQAYVLRGRRRHPQAREWSLSRQDVCTVLEDASEQARDNWPFNAGRGISRRGSGVRDTELRKSDYKGDVFSEPVWPAANVGIFGGN